MPNACSTEHNKACLRPCFSFKVYQWIHAIKFSARMNQIAIGLQPFSLQKFPTRSHEENKNPNVFPVSMKPNQSCPFRTQQHYP